HRRSHQSGLMSMRVAAALGASIVLLACAGPPATDSKPVPPPPPTIPPPSGPPVATGAAAGCNHPVALLLDGTVPRWGDGADGQLGDIAGAGMESSSPLMPQDLLWATKIVAGAHHTCAQLADSTLACWGDDFMGELGTDPSTEYYVPQPVIGIGDATDVAAGSFTTCSLNDHGEMR